jgi:hypothetical protein
VDRFRSLADRRGRWGDLPPRAREAIMNDMRRIDEFPPEYRRMIEEYLRQLNEDH